MHKPALIRNFSAIALLVSVSAPSLAAVDAAKFAELLKAKMALNSMTLETAGAELSGSNVVLKDASVKFSNGGEPVNVGDMTFENVSEQGEGYLVQKWAVAPVNRTEGDVTMSFKGASINNIHLTPTTANDPMATFLIYEGADFAGFEVIENGARAFGLGVGKVTMSPYKPNEKMDYNLVINDVYANFGTAKDSTVRETMTALGYPEMSGTLTMKGDWNPSDGRMNIPEFALDMKDVGRLNIAFDISGYTSNFARQMQDMAKSAASQSSEASGMAMMGLMGQLTFNSMSLRFDDASLTNKLIDYTAKTSNQPREAVVAQAKGMAPMMVMALQDPVLMQKVSEAVTAFVDNPKNFEIKATPAAPVSFAVLMATGMGAPAQLVQQLGLTVTANQ